MAKYPKWPKQMAAKANLEAPPASDNKQGMRFTVSFHTT
jgi:hypothetical protein